MKLINYLKGKKTFIAAAVMVILSGLKASGYIDESTYQLCMGIAGALGLTFLRMGMNN